MKLVELVKKSRSIRRFHTDIPVPAETLRALIDLARCIPSAWNRQPLKYYISNNAEKNALIYSNLVWPEFGNWREAAPEERPAAYILILGDTAIAAHFGVEAGIAAQTILLGAVEQGLGGCILGQLNQEGLRASLRIPARYKILLLLALGYPAERSILEAPLENHNQDFWRDETGLVHVRKRPLDEILLTAFDEA
ncbi:MAG: nitroreductase family protein [Anaerolineae bacterium]|nr:nitroreductase family protein [Anaerolineae bacterium]